MQQLGQFMPRECGVVFVVVVARMSEAISGAVTWDSRMSLRSSGLRDNGLME